MNKANEALRRARQERGWTQRHLAELLEVEEQTVRTWERGTRSPSLEFRPRLSQLFDLSLEELGFQPSDEKPHSNQTHLTPVQEAKVSDDLLLPVTLPLSSRLQQGDENRSRMLKRVRYRWIAGMLEHSLYRATLIQLGLKEQSGAVENPWQLTLQESDLPSQMLPAGTRIIQVYDDTGGDLLILGEPGAGKTTLLLDLARELLDRATNDTNLPIPVVFHLSSWPVKHLSLANWLIEELKSKYQVPHALASSWIAADQIQLLLDGLDEVDLAHRSGCVVAINSYRQQHGLVPMVVCSRSADYLALMRNVRLLLHTAVMVQPLSREQIQGYLSRFDGSLATMQETLQNDPILQEMASSPLMLNILMLTYHHQYSGETLQLCGSALERRTHVLKKYVEKTLQRRGVLRYTEEQTSRYLVWLAHYLQQERQTEFYIERMQPDCLLEHHLYQKYYLKVIRIIFGIGLTVGGALWACFRGDSFPTEPGLFFWLGGGKGNSLLGWMAPGLGGGLKGATSLGIIVTIVTVLIMVLGDKKEIPKVSLKAICHGIAEGFRNGLVIGSTVGMFASFIFIYALGFTRGIARGIGIGIFAGLIIGMMSELLALLRFESTPMKDEPSRLASQFQLPLKDRVLNGLTFMICGTLGFGTIFALQSGTINQLIIVYSLIIGLFYGMIYGMSNGTRIIHLGKEIMPAEIVTWSWQAAGKDFVKNIKNGTALGGTVLVSVVIVVALVSSLFYGVGYGLKYGAIYGSIVGLIAVVAAIITGVLTSGWSSNVINDEHQFVRPNEGIHRSMRNAVFAACFFGPIAGTVSGLISGVAFGLGGISGWPILGMGFTVVFSITFALQFLTLYGGIAFVEHMVLRWSLWREGWLPWNYVAFLDYAAERILLRKVGGGYIFIHRLLLEYFAGLNEEYQEVDFSKK